MRLPGASSLFPLAVLALLAGFTFWLERSSQEEGDGGRSKLRHNPDYWVEDFTVRRFGTDGSVQHALAARRMEHFPDDDSTEIAQPHLVRERDSGATTMTARSARLDKKGEHVQLIDDVRLVRLATSDAPEMIVTTSVLHVLPDDEYAYTDAPVIIRQGQSVVEGAGGLTINNKTQVATLAGPVRGTIRRQDK